MSKCWDCINARGNGCSWFRKRVPIEGWKIKEFHRKYSDRPMPMTYTTVLSCPEFEQDPPRIIKGNNYVPTGRDIFKGVYKNNKSGVKGVSWSKNIGKWQAYIGNNGKLVNLGYYAELDEAVAARRKAEDAVKKSMV
jgi:hypothetical protein